MRIGFDAKRIFHNNTGLGNYGRDVIRILHEYSPVDKFVLYNTKSPKIKRLETLARTQIVYPSTWFWKKLSAIWRLGPITNQVNRDNIDLFHGLSGETPANLKKNGIKSVVTIHDLIFLSHPNFYSRLDRIIYKLKFKHAVKNVEQVVAISEQTKRDIIKYLEVDEKKIQVVYQGCNAAYKKKYSIQHKQKIKEKYQLPDFFILNVGTLQERKNALSIVKSIQGTKMTLVLVGGEKKYARRIHDYIKQKKMGQQVQFLKNVPVLDLAIIYQMATIFCYPSICEGFGIPIIEALFSKTPVITSIGNCFGEAGGPFSVYVDPKDVKDLRKQLLHLFANPELRKKMALQGFEYVQKFRDELVAENLFNVYQKVLVEDKTHVESNTKPLTALMITYNEIEHIEAVIDNLDFADEIIIVDSFSNDGTIEKLKKYPKVKLIQRAFKNFTDQKSFALEQASHDWILFMDADERVTTALKKEIHDTINSQIVTADAYYFYRIFMFKDKVLRYSGWQTDKNYRLFRKSKVYFTPERIVHETLIVNGKSGRLKNKLIHYSYNSYEDYKGKMIKYGKMKAIEEVEKGYTPNPYHYLFRPFYKFINHYILRLGILDGKRGIIVSYLNALSVYYRYKELRLLRANKNAHDKAVGRNQTNR